MPGLPVTWPELLADRATIDDRMERLEDLEEDAAEGVLSPEKLLVRAGDTLMGLAVLLGPGVAAPGLDALEKAGAGRGGVERALLTLQPEITPLTPIDAVTAGNAGGVCGREDFLATAEEAERLLSGPVSEVRTIGDAARFRAALAASAYGLHDLAAQYAFGKPRTGVFMPGETFQANLQALIHYLAQAEAAGASEADVEPAIRDAVAAFPHKRADKLLDWGDLGWLGRILFHRFGKAPTAEVGQRLYDYVRRF